MGPRSHGLTFREHVPLAPISTIGVGGAARWFAAAASAEDVAEADQWARERGVPLVVIGGGSNVVIADAGVEGLVLQVGILGTTEVYTDGGLEWSVGAGECWDQVVDAAVSRGLAGLECLSGIPGRVGGTPIQNVGAYGQEVADTIDGVVLYDLSERELRQLPASACQFGYRTSRFKSHDAGRFVVCGVTFRLWSGPPTVTYPDIQRALHDAGVRTPSAADVRRTVLTVRRLKGMVLDPSDPDTRSVGSFFVNPTMTEDEREAIGTTLGAHPPGFPMSDGRVKVPAAWLIEQAGFQKGDADGPVAVSTKHTLALVNRGGASARDVLRMALRIKRSVGERCGVWLRPEPVFVGFATDDCDVIALRKGDG